MASNETLPTTATAHTPTPWHFGHSENPDVYHGEEHWVILSDPEESTGEAIADVETGPGPEAARANAEFIVRACNAHHDLRTASKELYDRLQEYLDFSDEQLIEQGHDGLVKAMDDIEAAWHKADGTQPENHATAA